MDDPLTAYFRREGGSVLWYLIACQIDLLTFITGLSLDNTHLQEDAYIQLFNPRSQLRSLSRRTTFTYDHSDAGYVWSVTSIDNSTVQSGTFSAVLWLKRLSRSFNWAVTHSIDVAVGPLEFCGNAIVQNSENGRTK